MYTHKRTNVYIHKFIAQLIYKFITQYKVDFEVTKHYSVFIKAKSGIKSTFPAAPKILSDSGQSVIGLA